MAPQSLQFSYCPGHASTATTKLIHTLIILQGWNGSGTIFFSMCNMRCVFCQNWDISQRRAGFELDASQLAGWMLRLQDEGQCHNINFVTPEHVAPQVGIFIDQELSFSDLLFPGGELCDSLGDAIVACNENWLQACPWNLPQMMVTMQVHYFLIILVP